MRPISCDFFVYSLEKVYLWIFSSEEVSFHFLCMDANCTVHVHSIISSSNLTMSPWSTIVVPRNNRGRNWPIILPASWQITQKKLTKSLRRLLCTQCSTDGSDRFCLKFCSWSIEIGHLLFPNPEFLITFSCPSWLSRPSFLLRLDLHLNTQLE